MSKLKEMIETLEKAGIDTSQFTIILGDGTRIAGNEKQYVEDVQLQNKTFRRWITAQTFRMLYEPSWNSKLHTRETGWYRWLENNHDYAYQFKVLADELHVLAKLEKRDPKAFEERVRFFNKSVCIATCEHCRAALTRKGYTMVVPNLRPLTVQPSYAAFKKAFLSIYYQIEAYLPRVSQHTKCPEWLDAYKGSGAYYSLQNMILYHGCKLPGFNVAPQKQYKILRDMLLTGTPVWQFHDLLLRTIEYNHFDLGESIRKHQ